MWLSPQKNLIIASITPFIFQFTKTFKQLFSIEKQKIFLRFFNEAWILEMYKRIFVKKSLFTFIFHKIGFVKSYFSKKY
jgi:hypothetical protein